MTTLTIWGTKNLNDANIQAFLDFSDPRAPAVGMGDTLILDPTVSTTLTIDNINLMVMGTLRMRPSSATVNHTIRFININEALVAGGGHFPITAVTHTTGTTVTFTVQTGANGQAKHNFTTDDFIEVQGFDGASADAAYNGTWDITAVTDWTVTATVSPAPPAGGNVTTLDTLQYIRINEPAKNDKGLWIMDGGVLDIAGTFKRTWTRAAGTLSAGATTINCQDTLTGWRIGDEVRITPTDLSYDHEETRTIATVSGTSFTTTALTYSHPAVTVKAGTTCTAEVVNLTNNVNIEGTAGARTQVMFHAPPPAMPQAQTITNLSMRYMGARAANNTELVARWGLHWHLNADNSRGSLAQGVISRDSGSHAFVPHGSHGVTFRDCIAIDVSTEPFWWDHDIVTLRNQPQEPEFNEDQSDDTLYDRCGASKVDNPSGVGNRLSAFLLTDFHTTGAGELRDCWAQGVRQGTQSAGIGWPEFHAGLGWKITGNTVVHNNRYFGLAAWVNNSDLDDPLDVICYHNGGGGFRDGAYSNTVRYHRGISFENGWAGQPNPAELSNFANGELDAHGRWKHHTTMYLDANGTCPSVVRIAEAASVPKLPVIIADSDFRNALTNVVLIDSSRQAKLVDFVRISVYDVGSSTPRELLETDFAYIDPVRSNVTAAGTGHRWRVQRRDDASSYQVDFPDAIAAHRIVTTGLPPFELYVTTAFLPAATAGVAYTPLTLASALGQGTKTWALKQGSAALPTGMTLSTGGVLSGTPTTPGTYPITVEVADGRGVYAPKTYSFVVGGTAVLQITTTSLPDAVVGDAYSQTVLATGGTAPRTFAIFSGALPTGLSLSSGGAITGTPTTAGSYSFTVRVTDAVAAHDNQAFTILTSNPDPVISTTSLPMGELTAPYSAQMVATSGTAPYTWAVTAGTLPTGVSMASTGAFSGTPTVAGPFTVTIQVTDAAARTAQTVLTIVIATALTMTTTSLPDAGVGAAYSKTLVVANGVTPYVWDLNNFTTLPTGLSLSDTGIISGTPLTQGTYSFAIRVQDEANVEVTRTFFLTIGGVTGSGSLHPSVPSFSGAGTGTIDPTGHIESPLPTFAGIGVMLGNPVPGSSPFRIRDPRKFSSVRGHARVRGSGGPAVRGRARVGSRIRSDYFPTSVGMASPPPVTGTGDVSVAAPAFSGLGAFGNVTGTGAFAASAAAFAGTGTHTPQAVTGTGALALAAASFAGAGLETNAAFGNITPAAASFAGTGAAGIVGPAAVTMGAAVLAGVGSEGQTATGAFAPGVPTFAGVGTETISGSGGISLAPAALAGSGGLTGADGSGDLAAAAASFAGSGIQTSDGVGGITAAPAVLAGTGTVGAIGTGDLAASAASFSGTSAQAITGTGSFQGGAAALAGIGVLTMAGTASFFSALAQLEGIGQVNSGIRTAAASLQGYGAAESVLDGFEVGGPQPKWRARLIGGNWRVSLPSKGG